ncbi:MAG: nucleoside hydrolase [Clostridia bacterium]|nr:nucleoside hydrolase [Clostridia bacterium]
MTQAQFLKNLEVPSGKVDVILDTDAYNEIDDQFAIAYMLRSEDKINVKAICAAPFFNGMSDSPADGMEKSYNEILRILEFAGHPELCKCTYRGSTGYLADEKTAQESDAANKIVELSKQYSPENPLYVVAIGAITNVASALIIDPSIKENIVIVWLGGHATSWTNTKEFNMYQDVAAARVVFGCGAPLVQLPCMGVVSEFRISRPELEYWLVDKNPLADYLARNTIKAAESYAAGTPWTRVIWDVTALAWLTNDNNRFMNSSIEHAPMPEYDHRYAARSDSHFYRYVREIKRDALMHDLIKKLLK